MRPRSARRHRRRYAGDRTPRSRRRRAGTQAAGTQLRPGRRAGHREDRRDQGPDVGRAAACHSRSSPGTRARDGTSGGWSPRGRPSGAGPITADGVPRSGPRASTWSSTGASWAGCTCSARSWPGPGSGSCASPPTNAPRRPCRCSRSASRPSAGSEKVVLADRMACLRADIVAGRVVPTPDYVRFASHYRFRPDFCQGHDPESKGIVENLVGYAKQDLMIGCELVDPGGDIGAQPVELAAANAAAVRGASRSTRRRTRRSSGPGRTSRRTRARPARRAARVGQSVLLLVEGEVVEGGSSGPSRRHPSA